MAEPSTPPDTYASAMRHLSEGRPGDARRLMRAAADAGHLPAIIQYAAFVEHGIGGRPREGAAMAWFERAARGGDRTSCVRLARWHLSRNSVPQAKFWLGEADGDPRAMILLARLYMRSRSARATERAKRALSTSFTWSGLADEEQAELDALKLLLKDRNPDPIWSPNNQRRAAGSASAKPRR